MATNDTITGTSFGEFYIFGDGDGSDTIDLGGGTDMVGYDGDTPIYAYVDNGTILVGRGDDVDTLINVEKLLGSDSLSDTLDVTSVTGNVSVNLSTGDVIGAGGLTSAIQFEYVLAGSGNDTLVGNDSANWLVGGNGNDTITGDLGGDYLDGGAGNDLFNETAGNGTDTIDGGAGTDTVSYDDNDASAPIYTYLLDGTAYVGRSGQTDILSNIETIVGTDSLADILDLSSDTDGESVDLLNGTVTGVTGLSAISQFEYVIAGSGNDSLIGDSNANWLVGGDGNDSLTGDGGNDYLDGQAGDDTYLFQVGFGNDSVADASGSDTLLLGNTITQANVALFENGNGNLEIGLTNSSGDLITAQGIDRVELGNGYYMTDAEINQVVANMAAYAASNGISMTSLSDVENNTGLLNIIAAGWHQ